MFFLLILNSNSFGNEKTYVVEKERLQTIFEKDQLLYVSNSNLGFDTLKNLKSTFFMNSTDIALTEVVNLNSNNDFDNSKKNNYLYSHIVLFYIILLSVIVVSFKNSRNVLFSFSLKNPQFSDYLIFVFVVLTCFLASALFEFNYFKKM